eukprot:763329-Hanusia_phi.AAC.5
MVAQLRRTMMSMKRVNFQCVSRSRHLYWIVFSTSTNAFSSSGSFTSDVSPNTEGELFGGVEGDAALDPEVRQDHSDHHLPDEDAEEDLEDDDVQDTGDTAELHWRLVPVGHARQDLYRRPDVGAEEEVEERVVGVADVIEGELVAREGVGGPGARGREREETRGDAVVPLGAVGVGLGRPGAHPDALGLVEQSTKGRSVKGGPASGLVAGVEHAGELIHGDDGEDEHEEREHARAQRLDDGVHPDHDAVDLSASGWKPADDGDEASKSQSSEALEDRALGVALLEDDVKGVLDDVKDLQDYEEEVQPAPAVLEVSTYTQSDHLDCHLEDEESEEEETEKILRVL